MIIRPAQDLITTDPIPMPQVRLIATIHRHMLRTSTAFHLQALRTHSLAYGGMGPSMYEPSRNRSIEEISTPHGHQRSLLGVQEINRKGRISPLPQAVQGAQPQLAGPAGEPGIKSEFGRMFSGIGTGVGTLSSPVPAGAQLAYGGAGLLRREELDAPQEPPVEVVKTTGRGKRRKLKEEDDEASNGRLTPVGGRAKKAKGHHHHHGYKSTPKPLPWDLIEGKENCTLMVKIGKEHLSRAAREEITSRRAVWGTDVYTDDSDVVAACIHAGWIRAYPTCEPCSMARANGVKEKSGTSQQGSSALSVLTEPPKNGPMPVPEKRDPHVTLLILPRLEKYASTTRFGITSREFGGPVGDDEAHQRAIHDGISFMVIGLRWVTNGGASQNRLRGKERRERIRKALAEVEMAPAWISRPANRDSSSNGQDGAEREGDAGLGWWKRTASKPSSEGDKENQNRVTGGEKQQQQAVEEATRIDERDVGDARVEKGMEVEARSEDAEPAKKDEPPKDEDATAAEERVEATSTEKVPLGATGNKDPEAPATEKQSEEAQVDKKPQGVPTENGAESAKEAETAEPEKAAEA
ncbi:hypothetical protein NEMBOFW57_004701 [Staphylotrichum longicolle]|uniref:Uncharacterized protein n=1 Tax=Staphylotrichum longicolle TaxID=669026 RepID=A0AAD4F856_9PEZI|nr:hypothetical protein NEMBOFW57_004701 [Staphylotrichum longicolle]